MDDVKRAEDLVNQLNLQILTNYKVEISTDNKDWNKYILFITSSQFILCKYDKLTSHIWKTITRFEYNSRRLYINFEETSYIIQSSQILNLVSDLCEILQRVLLPSELARIDFTIIDTPQIEPGTQSVDARFMMQNTENLSTTACKKAISSLVKYRIPSFRISNAPEVSFFLPLYLDILPFIKTLKMIEIPIIGVDFMKLISNFPLELRYTRKIEINGSISPILITFLERTLLNRKQSKLNTLSFSLSNFNRSDLSSISNAITKGPINSIEFHRAFHQSSSSYFYSTFLSHQMNGLLWILNLDRTTGLDIKKLFPKLRNIPFVSLAFCDLDVIEVLTVASQSKMEKLTILNLTGNNANSSSIEKVENIKNIKSLKKLICDDIVWPDHFMVQFLTVLFDQFENNLSLSLSHAKASKDEWSEVFDFFKESQYNGLIGFSWCSNPVNQNIFHFLRRNDKLRRIDFDLCFSENDEDLVRDFADLLSSLEDLRMVSFAGSKEKHIGPTVTTVIESCKSHKKLSRVNFPSSFGGDEALPALLDMIDDCPALKVVNFEGFSATDSSSFVEAMLKLAQASEERSLKVSFPVEDVKALNKDDQNTLKNAYRSNYTDLESSSSKKFAVHRASEEMLNKRRVFYRYSEKPPFPAYITEKTIQRLNEELADVPQVAEKTNLDKILNSGSSLLSRSSRSTRSGQLNEVSFQNSKTFNVSLSKAASKLKKRSSSSRNDDDNDDDSLSASVNKSKESITESEHPFPSVDDYAYSDQNEAEKAKNKKPQVTVKSSKKTSKDNKNKDKDVDDADDESNSFSSMNINLFVKSSSNLPKNLPKNMPMNDYDSDGLEYQSPIRLNSSKTNLTGDFDSLSESSTLSQVPFNESPILARRQKYNFSSEISLNNDQKQQKKKNSPASFNFDIEEEEYDEEVHKNILSEDTNEDEAESNLNSNFSIDFDDKSNEFDSDLKIDKHRDHRERKINKKNEIESSGLESAEENYNSKREQIEFKEDHSNNFESALNFGNKKKSDINSNDNSSSERFRFEGEKSTSGLESAEENYNSKRKQIEFKEDHSNSFESALNFGNKRNIDIDSNEKSSSERFRFEGEKSTSGLESAEENYNSKTRQIEFKEDHSNSFESNANYNKRKEEEDKSDSGRKKETESTEEYNNSNSEKFRFEDEKSNGLESAEYSYNLDQAKMKFKEDRLTNFESTENYRKQEDQDESDEYKERSKLASVGTQTRKEKRATEEESSGLESAEDVFNKNAAEMTFSEDHSNDFESNINMIKQSSSEDKSEVVAEETSGLESAEENFNKENEELKFGEDHSNNFESTAYYTRQVTSVGTQTSKEKSEQKVTEKEVKPKEEEMKSNGIESAEEAFAMNEPELSFQEDHSNNFESNINAAQPSISEKETSSGYNEKSEEKEEEEQKPIETKSKEKKRPPPIDVQPSKPKPKKKKQQPPKPKPEEEEEEIADKNKNIESNFISHVSNPEEPIETIDVEFLSSSKSSKSSSRKSSKLSNLSENESSKISTRSKDGEIDLLPTSSDANESGKDDETYTPTTPKLSFFSKDIFSFGDEQYLSNPVISRQVTPNKRYISEKILPEIGTEHNWTFPIEFDMRPDLSEFKKIEKEYSPDVLYDNLYNEKRDSPSRSSSPKSKK